MIWPYRPRQGYPSAPAWLVALLLVVTVVLFVALMALIHYVINPNDFWHNTI